MAVEFSTIYAQFPHSSKLFEYTVTGHLLPRAPAQLLLVWCRLCFVPGKDSCPEKCYVWKAREVSRYCVHCAAESTPPGTWVNMKKRLRCKRGSKFDFGHDFLRFSHMSVAISLKDAFKKFPAALVGRGSVEMTSMAGTAKAGSLQIHQYMRRIPHVHGASRKLTVGV